MSLRKHFSSAAMVVLTASVLLTPVVAKADCTWFDVLGDGARAATVRSSFSRAHFVQDETLVPGCPNESPECLASSYLVPDDVVLTGSVQDAYTCVAFINPRGANKISYVGFLPTVALSPLPDADQRPDDWTGHWVGDQDIRISYGNNGTFVVRGTATEGRDHIGAVEGEMKPADGVLAFTMDDADTLPYDAGDEVDCRIQLWRRGPYLLARDNNKCGGVNVSFSGFYRREQ